MIQLINFSGIDSQIESRNFDVSRLSSPNSLDEYSINIIDLRDNHIWEHKSDSYSSVDCNNDLSNLGTMICNSLKTRIIIFLPQELKFQYDYANSKFYKDIELKNILDSIRKDILNDLHNIFYDEILFENTRTKIGDYMVAASFYFNVEERILTNSINSNKPTTITKDDVILTTLNLKTENEILGFINKIKLIDKEIEIPEWIKELKMFNDIEQELLIEENEAIIDSAKEHIYSAKEILVKNNEYKSILYLNGDTLEEITFEILEELLECDLSTFTDEKKEDFIIKLDEVTFIGEIKGVTSNLRSEHISQLDVHLQTYLDELEKDNINENVKSILLINHQRNKELSKRQEIHERQISLAKRNGSLIIETSTLLKIFEDFKKGEITSIRVKDILTEDIGLFEYK